MLALNNKQHLNLAARLLTRDIKTILVLPGGILKFKYDADLRKYSDRSLILSYAAPNQEVTHYSYISSFKYRCEIADAILYTGENRKDVRNLLSRNPSRKQRPPQSGRPLFALSGLCGIFC